MANDLIAKNGLSLDRLVTLCAVIDAGSITAAAASSLSRQSQFSRQIKDLEGAFGLKLFVRVGKTLKPTPFGEQLARVSRTFFATVSDLAAQETGKPERLSVGGGEAILRWILTPCLSALRHLDPPVHCQMRSLRTADVLRELQLGRIDLGLLRRSAITEDLACEVVGTMKFALIVPRSLLRSRSPDEVYEGKPLPYAELVGDGQLATQSREIAKDAGIRLNRVIQAETLSLLLAAVEHGDSAAFVPTFAISNLPTDRFAVVQVDKIRSLDRELVLAWLPEAADQKAALKNALRPLTRGLIQMMTEAGA